MLNRRDSINNMFVVMFVDEFAQLRLHLHEMIAFLVELLAPGKQLLLPACGQLYVRRQVVVQLFQHMQIRRPR